MHTDESSSPWPTAATIIAALIGAAALTFCTPAPAAERDDCVSLTYAFAVVVDPDVSVDDASEVVEQLPERLLPQLERYVMAYLQVSPPVPLDRAVPIVYEHCTKQKWAV